MKLCGIKINKIKYYSLFSAFVYHVPQFLEMHGTLMQFNCQPVEKKNHWQSQAFHRGSQKGGKNTKYTVQVGTSKNIKLFIFIHNYN